MVKGTGQSGFAALHVGKVHGASAVLNSSSRTPLFLLTPKPRGESVWAYTSNFGGGMVAGDRVEMEVRIDPHSVCFLGSQASNKIYRNPSGIPCAHELRASVGAGAILILAPDPVQCFADAAYQQRQRFDLNAGASLIVLDWISAGRLARGERWQFRKYSSRNEVFFDGKARVIDAIDLNPHNIEVTNRFCAGRFNCLATAIMIGPAFANASRSAMEQISAQSITPGEALVASASLIEDGVIFRMAGISVEEVGHALYRYLRFVEEFLKDDPWARKR